MSISIATAKEKKLSILFLEDTIADVEIIQRHLKKAGLVFSPIIADNKAEFIRMIEQSPPDVILSDHTLPQFNSMEALQIINERGLNVPFILVTGSVSEEFAVDCIKAGADDYILKDRLTRLPAAINNALSRKNTEREKNIIQSLNDKLSAAYDEINSSIKYAQRIQKVILPDIEILTSVFPESFIVYKPKNIVSGDFYWFAEHDDKFIVAVADCTGHGVPGAFMSIIGSTLLNDIVNRKGITVPAEILSLLNDAVRSTLKQEKENAESKDGMDIGICCINKTYNYFEFAGANRSLFYFKDNVLETIKADKQGIGGFYSNKELKFKNYRISFEKNDSIYLFTDGYADQFGGKKEKKMMTRNFTRLVTRIQGFTIDEQREMLTGWLKEWKGNLEQTDDILVIGIRL
jgi:serine phosphatase RsbU (regulator of sigma subunit)/CheY-like chemotaxis protein